MTKIKPGKNLGVIEQEMLPSDYVAGANSPIPYAVNVIDGSWQGYEAPGEPQTGVYVATQACVSFSAIKTIVLQLNRMMKVGLIPASILDQCRVQGYIDANSGLFNFSERYVAKMSGTTQDGNSARTVWDTIRHYGLVGQQVWPFPDAQRTPVFAWDDFYAPIPQSVIDQGKKFCNQDELPHLFDLVYEQVTDTSPASLEYHLKQSPLQVLTYTCPPWNTTDIIKACGIKPSSHATVIAGTQEGVWLVDLDSYNPWEKKLAWDYYINFAFKPVVTLAPQDVPALPVPRNKALEQLNAIAFKAFVYQKFAVTDVARTDASHNWSLLINALTYFGYSMTDLTNWLYAHSHQNKTIFDLTKHK